MKFPIRFTAFIIAIYLVSPVSGRVTTEQTNPTPDNIEISTKSPDHSPNNSSEKNPAKVAKKASEAPSVARSIIGDFVSADSDLTIKCIDQRRGFGSGVTYDADISSPKSASFSSDGKKLYVNSLEGGKTVVYDVATRKKLKTIHHSFQSGEGRLWLAPSGYYPFTHYTDGRQKSFMGKPVEEAFSKDGRYLFIPYYRRTFDINAQDPSALAVIDTQTDEIVLLVETGPLPKMVSVSNDGKLLAITHWGDNTVGFLDISNPDIRKWHHLPPVAIGKKLKLDFSLVTPVNRDSGSGNLLRGTVFLPGDSLLLVSGMAGPISVIDVKRMKHIGAFPQFSSVRHIIRHGDLLYMSRNVAGEVLTVPVSEIVKAIDAGKGHTRSFSAAGVRSAKVGGGARTLKVSPSGKYIFVACNTASALYIVRTDDMKVIGQITVDSFPVGLDISPDGSMVVTTSQGRKNGEKYVGGNSVNFFEIAYSTPELSIEATPIEAEEDLQSPEESGVDEDTIEEQLSHYEQAIIIAICILTAVIIILLIVIIRKRKSKRSDD